MSNTTTTTCQCGIHNAATLHGIPSGFVRVAYSNGAYSQRYWGDLPGAPTSLEAAFKNVTAAAKRSNESADLLVPDLAVASVATTNGLQVWTWHREEV